MFSWFAFSFLLYLTSTQTLLFTFIICLHLILKKLYFWTTAPNYIFSIDYLAMWEYCGAHDQSIMLCCLAHAVKNRASWSDITLYCRVIFARKGIMWCAFFITYCVKNLFFCAIFNTSITASASLYVLNGLVIKLIRKI